MTKHEADVIGGLNMTDQISNEAYKQIMIAAQDENEPCEDCISRQAAKKALEDRFIELQKRHDDKRYETNYCLNTILELPPVNPQKPKSEWEHDHEILKAYSDGANAVLDEIRAEIEKEIVPKNSDQYDYEAKWQNLGLRMALKVIDKYKSEEVKE